MDIFIPFLLLAFLSTEILDRYRSGSEFGVKGPCIVMLIFSTAKPYPQLQDLLKIGRTRGLTSKSDGGILTMFRRQIPPCHQPKPVRPLWFGRLLLFEVLFSPWSYQKVIKSLVQLMPILLQTLPSFLCWGLLHSVLSE